MNVLLESPLGGLLARPWLDAAGLFGLRHYMPLSRLWAAANTAKGDAAVFRDQAGGRPAFWSTFQLRPLLTHHDRLKRAADEARRAWETAIFDADQASDPGLLDDRRRRAATLHQMTRGYFTPMLLPRRIVSVLGETDRWGPYDHGLALARQWQLPEENVFRYRLGHLGMPVQLTRDPAPFERLRQALRAM